MKIYNELKNEILTNIDLTKGYLKNDKLIIKTIPAQEEIKEKFHYEFKEYSNGGKDRIKIIDVPYQNAKPETYEYEEIQIFVPYTVNQIIDKRINELKLLLSKTDYQAIKFAEGELSAEEYLPIKQKRRAYRAEINSLEEKLKNFA